MLFTKLLLLSSTPGVDAKSATRVLLGAAIFEDDASLPYRRVQGVVDWGDGTEPYTIAPVLSPFNSVSTLRKTAQGAVVTVTASPTPYTGSFTLIFGQNTNVGTFSYDVSNAVLRQALLPLVEGEDVLVEGDISNRAFVFDSNESAAKFSLGADTLFAPVVLPVHLYASGNFTAKISASNFRSPTPDELTVELPLSLNRTAARQSLAAPSLLGPILPLDGSYPNTAQWNFNMSTDLQVLVSNVKMILIVEPGERLMLPEYGCALRQFLFDPLTPALEQDVVAEIKRAITTWEPRVKTEKISASIDGRILSVSMTGVSLLNQENFQLNVELER